MHLQIKSILNRMIDNIKKEIFYQLENRLSAEKESLKSKNKNFLVKEAVFAKYHFYKAFLKPFFLRPKIAKNNDFQI